MVKCQCPLCGSDKLFYDPARGEYYCGECGYVYDYDEVPSRERLAEIKEDISINNLKINSYKEDNTTYAVNEIYRLSSWLRMPKHMVREAINIYINMIYKNNLHRKLNIPIEDIIPALIILIYKKYSLNCNYDVLFKYAKSDPNAILSAYYKLYNYIE